MKDKLAKVASVLMTIFAIGSVTAIILLANKVDNEAIKWIVGIILAIYLVLLILMIKFEIGSDD